MLRSLLRAKVPPTGTVLNRSSVPHYPSLQLDKTTHLYKNYSTAATPITTMTATNKNSPNENSSTMDKTEKPLPKLSSKDFRIYNSMAEHMDYYHNHFRRTWDELYKSSASGKLPARLSERGYISLGEQFCRALTMHHGIEEAHIFPVLAKRMPIFGEGAAAGELLMQHRLIHAGIEELEAYLSACRRGERKLKLDEVKGVLDGFGEVLWAHLDKEVKQLGAENMRKFWSLEEMASMPM